MPKGTSHIKVATTSRSYLHVTRSNKINFVKTEKFDFFFSRNYTFKSRIKLVVCTQSLAIPFDLGKDWQKDEKPSHN